MHEWGPATWIAAGPHRAKCPGRLLHRCYADGHGQVHRLAVADDANDDLVTRLVHYQPLE
jgi:hypothetical protein